MAGTINFAMTQQFDSQGDPLSGGLLYFFAAGTTTPQNAFLDPTLTLVYPNPIVLDSSGRVPMFYLADGFIKIRLADKNGVTVIAADQLLVIGPSSGSGGGGGSVDPTTVIATGDIKARYGTGTLTGYARCNGNSIGKAGSGATEWSGDFTQALFEYLWPFPNITLNTAKGASANADFLAGRRLNLPDLRGTVIAGLDDMGASAAGRLTSAGLGISATVLGNLGAAQSRIQSELPIHSHGVSGITNPESADHNHNYAGTTSGESATHTHPVSPTGLTASGNAGTVGASSALGTSAISVTGINSNDHTHNYGGVTAGASNTHTHALNITSTTVGTNAAMSIVQPTMVLTFYIKL